MNYIKFLLPLLILLVVSYFSIRPLFISGFFPIHDDTQVARVFEMGKALKDGMFPVRWVSDLGYGYGYPIFNFYAPLAYYVGGVFVLLGLNALDATKMMMGFGVMLSAIFMYFLAREFWGKMGGLLSAVLYLYFPYHAVNIYVRGDVAEYYAYAFIPLMFLGVYKIFKTEYIQSNNSKLSASSSKSPIVSQLLDIFKNNNWKWITVSAVGYAGVILSHNLTALMVTPYLIITSIILGIVSYRKNKNLTTARYLLITIILGWMLSAFYSLPTLMEMQYTNVLSQIGGGADFKDHFVCIQQLWNSPWGFGGSTKDCLDGLSFKIGKIHLVFLFIAFLFAIYYLFKKHREKSIFVFFSVVCIIFSIFIMLSYSKIIWETFPLMAFFQYPWRFLLIIGFFCSFAGGYFLYVAEEFIKKYKLNIYFNYGLTTIIILLVIFMNLSLFEPQTIFPKNVNDYTSDNAIKWVASKISDEYMPKGFIKPKFEDIVYEKVVEVEQNIPVMSVLEKTQQIQYSVNTDKPVEVLLKIAHFPAWNILIDGKNAEYRLVRNGYQIVVPQGNHTITAIFIQTPIEKVGNAISITGIAVLIIGIIGARKRNNKNL